MAGQEFICIFEIDPFCSPLSPVETGSYTYHRGPSPRCLGCRNQKFWNRDNSSSNSCTARIWNGEQTLIRRALSVEGEGDSLSVFTLAGSTKGRSQQRRQNIIESPELSPLTTGHSCTTCVTIKLTAMLLTKVNQTELIIIVLSHTNRAKFCLNLIGHQALK